MLLFIPSLFFSDSLLFCLSLVASSASEGVIFNENKAEPAEDAQTVSHSPKSSLNLAALKAAFSNHISSGNKSGKEKTPSCGPVQKTLQCFFKDSAKPACSQSVKTPLKPTRDTFNSLPAGRSVLDGFRYEGSEKDSKRDGAVSSHDVTGSAPDVHRSEPEWNSVRDESLVSAAHSSRCAPEDPELQTEAGSSAEDSTLSPDAKRSRTEDLRFTTGQTSGSSSNCLDTSSSVVDVLTGLQRRTRQVQFSLKELSASLRRLQEQQKRRSSEELQYRRFRAKISPGENQSAENELKKEIR